MKRTTLLCSLFLLYSKNEPKKLKKVPNEMESREERMKDGKKRRKESILREATYGKEHRNPGRKKLRERRKEHRESK